MNRLYLAIMMIAFCRVGQAQYLTCKNGVVNFVSEAPLELIKAQSSALSGIIDLSKQTFAFSIDSKSFHGFNSILQKEHFVENYMESEKFPTITFTGKFIDKCDFTMETAQSIRVKGQLNLHGVSQERIIKGEILKDGNTIKISSNFTVPLADHNISIPKLVFQKIAEEIHITVTARFFK